MKELGTFFTGEFETINFPSTKILLGKSGFDKSYYRDELFRICEIKFPHALVNAVVKRKSEFLAGRYCAKRLLKNFGIYNFQIDIAKGRQPTWPAGYVGSITHSDRLAVAALASTQNYQAIGIDVEPIIDQESYQQIKTATTSVSEIFLIANTCKNTFLRDFTLIFSLKESFFKAIYPSFGDYFDFSAIEIQHIEHENQEFYFLVKQNFPGIVNKNSIQKGYYIQLDTQTYLTMFSIKTSK